MPVPFGISVGDFIAVTELVHDVARALKDSTGSRTRFLNLIEEFERLEQALLAISTLQAPEGFEEQLVIIKTSAARCEGVILAFLHKHSKFHAAFESEKSKHWWRGALKKVEWQLYKKDDVAETHRALQSHTGMIGMLLSAFHINCTYRSQDCWTKTSTDLVRRLDQVDGQQVSMSALLQSLLTSALTMQSDAEQKFAKIFDFLNSIADMQKSCLSIPAQVLREQPVYFSDAHGLLTAFDLSFITSEDAFLYVLKGRFDSPGARRIEREQFTLQNTRTKKDIDRSRCWKTWFRPGQRVDMSMLFDDPDRRMTNCCPRCGCANDIALDVDAEWQVAVKNLRYDRLANLVT